MNILLINDDGYKSVMTKDLKEYLTALGHCVYSFLPENDHSGVGSSISASQEIYYWQEQDNDFVVRGTPADCTMLGIQYLQEHKKTVDIVVSGINKGTNFRQMIRYSGTVNAAKEALAYNIPAIAISTYRAIDDVLLKKGMSSIETMIHFMCLRGRYRERAFGVNVNIVSGNKLRCDYEKKYTYMKPPLFYIERGVDKTTLKLNKILKQKPESFLLLDGFCIEDNEVRQAVIKRRVRALKKQVNNYLVSV